MGFFDETELTRHLQQGDQKAFFVLYDRYHVLLYNWAFKLVKVPVLAEDIVQDVFIKIWEIKTQIKPELSFPAFLYKICRNKAFASLKKIAADEVLRHAVITEIGHQTENTENLLVWQEYEKCYHAAIEQLPAQRKKVFIRCRQEGMSYDQVAAELGISRNTVKEHMVMAVKNIKSYFEEHGDISLLVLLMITNRL